MKEPRANMTHQELLRMGLKLPEHEPDANALKLIILGFGVGVLGMWLVGIIFVAFLGVDLCP